ncbi:MAG: pyridoxamine 5'-phosphate oxidase family protein [Planctomycetota bacterium]
MARLGAGGGWRIPVLATQRGGLARQRSIVLRGVERDSGLLWFHTDVRSGKVRDIEDCPQVSLLFYDSATETQLAVNGRARVLTDGAEVDGLWEQSACTSLRMYLAPGVPGTECGAGDCNLPEGVRGRIPDRGEVLAGRVNFAGVVVEVARMEWLQLSRGGNGRAEYECGPGGVVSGRWVLP